uniref:Uncharacterized protein n=1 Tax=Bionectria ochroleuca TaxID=29856 RepID=A0A8H7NK85_BIOOC
MTDRYVYASTNGRSSTFNNPERASMPSSIGYSSLHAGDMHVMPVSTRQQPITTPRGYTVASTTTAAPTNNRSYVYEDPRAQEAAGYETIRNRRSTIDSNVRPRSSLQLRKRIGLMAPLQRPLTYLLHLMHRIVARVPFAAASALARLSSVTPSQPHPYATAATQYPTPETRETSTITRGLEIAPIASLIAMPRPIAIPGHPSFIVLLITPHPLSTTGMNISTPTLGSSSDMTLIIPPPLGLVARGRALTEATIDPTLATTRISEASISIPVQT